MNNELLEISVRTRDRVIYSGKAKSVTSVNDKGTFDILPKHSNFISLINELLIIREPGGTTRKIPVDSGILRVERDQIEVFLGIKK